MNDCTLRDWYTSRQEIVIQQRDQLLDMLKRFVVDDIMPVIGSVTWLKELIAKCEKGYLNENQN